MVASPGFEPRQTDPESVVLPLHQEARTGRESSKTPPQSQGVSCIRRNRFIVTAMNETSAFVMQKPLHFVRHSARSVRVGGGSRKGQHPEAGVDGLQRHDARHGAEKGAVPRPPGLGCGTSNMGHRHATALSSVLLKVYLPVSTRARTFLTNCMESKPSVSAPWVVSPSSSSMTGRSGYSSVESIGVWKE